MPSIASPRLSPDGKRIAYVVMRADLERSAYKSDIWLIDADGRNNMQLTRSTGSDARPRWSPDGKRIAFRSDRDGRNAIWLIEPNGGEAIKLTNEATGIGVFEWSPDGKSLAFTRVDAPSADEERRIRDKDDARVIGQNDRHTHLYVIDVESRAVRQLSRGTYSVFNFDWSPDSKSIAFARGPGLGLDDQYRTDIYLARADGEGEPRPLVVQPGIDYWPTFSPDGKSVAFFSGGGVHDWLVEHHVHVVDLDGGKPRLVSRAYDRTPDDLTWSDDGRTLWLNGPWNSTNQLFRIGTDGSGFANVSNVNGMVTDAHIAAGRVTFILQSLMNPPELHVSELAKWAPRQLTNVNDAYRGRAADTRVIRWKNPKDGLEIEGLLTLPPSYKPGTRVPLLTWAHGGPASRFDQAFLGYLGTIYAPHALAARGFAILRPNPRGSGGYGTAFRAANRSDWAGMDFADINAGIDSLIEQGIADPKRLGMMGWSYGGYMTAWAIGNSDRFRALSIGAGIADLLSMHGTSDIRDYLPHYFPGPEPREADPTLNEMRHAPMSFEQLRARSPLWHVRKIGAPVLILHGELDDRVPLSQGTMLYRVLDELGVDVTMVIYPRSAHTPREPKQRIDVARRNLEFFSRHIARD